MAYNYIEEKQWLFTDDGQRAFLRVRDKAKELLTTAGAFRMHELLSGCAVGDSWHGIACVDRLVELREIREVEQESCATQHRIYQRGL